MDDRDTKIGVRTYLTPEEAKDFHKLFMISFLIFTLVAVIAHFLVWQWRPWLPGPNGYPAATMSTATSASAAAPASATTASADAPAPATHS